MNNIEQRQRMGNEIADMRKKKGLTQGELAERCGMAQNHISRIEKGYYSFGFDILQAVAEAMDCTITIAEK